MTWWVAGPFSRSTVAVAGRRRRPAQRLRCAGTFLALAWAAACTASDDQARDPDPDSTGDDDALIERGAYLVEGPLHCFYCHSERDWSAPGAPIVGVPGAGREYARSGEDRFVARNLTPDRDVGIGLWTDEELGRAIRLGISRDGRPLSSLMPFDYFRRLSDAELESVIAYLRSRPPVDNGLEPTSLSSGTRAELEGEERMPLDPIDLRHPDPVERGRALVLVSRCQACHTPWEAPTNPGVFSGGNIANSGQGPADGNGPRQDAFTSNLTPSASGLSYDAETFKVFVRTGRGGTMRGSMPWQAIGTMSDADLEAVYSFLRTMPPVEHRVNNTDEPTFCVVCGQEHGLGVLNRPPEPPEAVPLSPQQLEAFAGDYYAEAYGWTLRLQATDSGLVAREGEGRTVDGSTSLAAAILTPTRLLVEDWGVLDAEFGPDGRVARLVEVNVDRYVVERVR